MLSSADLSFYKAQGYLILRDFSSASTCSALRSRATYLLEARDPSNACSCSISGFAHNEDDPEAFFRESTNNISFFYENRAFNSDGQLVGDKFKSVIKIGHALHDLDPVFQEYSHSPRICELTRQLGYKKPLIGQSRFFFKLPGTRGKIYAHQDSTVLYTEPFSCFAIWLALEDATVENGCMWVIPGSHQSGLQARAVRDRETGRWRTERLSNFTPWSESSFIPLEVPAGTAVILKGETVHKSEENISSVSRQAYSLHIIEGDANHVYPKENWLQRSGGFGELGSFRSEEAESVRHP